MNKKLVCLFGLIVLCISASAQDSALVERVNRLSVYVEELQADKARQQKQINDLTREVERLKEQAQQANQAASRNDVSALAASVKALEREHRSDLNDVAQRLDKLASTPSVSRSSSAGGGHQASGYPHTIAPGDTLSAIAKAYQAELNIRVTVDDILAANPGLDPKRLQVGKIIIIPEP